MKVSEIKSHHSKARSRRNYLQVRIRSLVCSTRTLANAPRRLSRAQSYLRGLERQNLWSWIDLWYRRAPFLRWLTIKKVLWCMVHTSTKIPAHLIRTVICKQTLRFSWLTPVEVIVRKEVKKQLRVKQRAIVLASFHKPFSMEQLQSKRPHESNKTWTYKKTVILQRNLSKYQVSIFWGETI